MFKGQTGSGGKGSLELMNRGARVLLSSPGSLAKRAHANGNLRICAVQWNGYRWLGCAILAVFPDAITLFVCPGSL